MKICAVLALALVACGCYNNPRVSERAPGSVHAPPHLGPAVGPGTVPGGSTAGIQPPPKAAHGEHTTVQPTHSGAQPAEQGLGHAGAAQPSAGHDTLAPKGDPARQGNQPGVGGRTENPGSGHAPGSGAAAKPKGH